MTGVALALANLEGAGALTPTELRLPVDISPTEFEAVGRAIKGMDEALHWAFGDWIAHGEKVFGEESYQYIEALGISEVSRMQYIRVATRVAPERRIQGLSWSHHRAVAPLDDNDQVEWLQRALESGWSKSELEVEIKYALRGNIEKTSRRYVIEVVATVAERVWDAAVQSTTDPDVFFVPRQVMEDLAAALGEL